MLALQNVCLYNDFEVILVKERETIESLYRGLKETTTPEEYERIITDETRKLILKKEHPHVRITNTEFIAKSIVNYEQHFISFSRLSSIIWETTYDAMNGLSNELYNKYRFYLYAEPNIYYNGTEYPRIKRLNESVFVEFHGDQYSDQRFNNPNLSLTQTIAANRFLDSVIDEYERTNKTDF